MHFVKHDGYTHRVGGLFDTVYREMQSQQIEHVIFRAPEDEPLVVSAFDRVIAYIVDAHNLASNQVTIEMVDHVPAWHTDRGVIKLTPAKSWDQCKLLIKRDLCSMQDDARVFGAFFGRFTHQRFCMAYFLETHMPQLSLVNFQPGLEWVQFELEPFGDRYAQELQWFQSRKNPINDVESQHNGCISAWQCLPVYHELFGLYEVEIVIETHTVDLGVFTEKTAKCLCAGKPFFLVGTTGQLQRLHDMGFETWSSCWDETYDTCTNTAERFHRVKQELKKISRLSPSELSDVITQARTIAGRNRERYDAIIDCYYQKWHNN